MTGWLWPNWCTRVNVTLQRVEEANKKTMRIFVKVPPFEPNAEMNETYFFSPSQ